GGVPVAFSADGRRALTVGADGEDGSAVLRDVATGDEIREWKVPGGGITAAALSADGRQAPPGARRVHKPGPASTLTLWDAAAGKLVRTFHGHQDAVAVLAFAPDGRRALAGGHDGTLTYWDLTKERPEFTATAHIKAVGPTSAVAFAPDGKSALSGGLDGRIRHWDLSTGREVVRIASPPGSRT